MINSASRKMEISRISTSINNFDNLDDKELMAAISFPRIYSHYENFTSESLKYLIEEIFIYNPELFKLKDKVMLFILTLYNRQSTPEKIMKMISNINNTSLLDIIDKKNVISNVVQSKPHEFLKIILECFEMDNTPEYNQLKITSMILASKYKARCNIAHGDEDLSCINIDDWNKIKDKTLEIFDLFETVIDGYVNNKKYLK